MTEHNAYKIGPTVSYVLVLADISRTLNGGGIYISPQILGESEEFLLMDFHFITTWIVHKSDFRWRKFTANSSKVDNASEENEEEKVEGKAADPRWSGLIKT